MADASALGEESLCSPLVDASASIDRGAIWTHPTELPKVAAKFRRELPYLKSL